MCSLLSPSSAVDTSTGLIYIFSSFSYEVKCVDMVYVILDYSLPSLQNSCQ